MMQAWKHRRKLLGVCDLWMRTMKRECLAIARIDDGTVGVWGGVYFRDDGDGLTHDEPIPRTRRRGERIRP